jgi:hypothetical protein
MPGVEAIDALDDEDPCQLIGDLDDEDVPKVTRFFKHGA